MDSKVVTELVNKTLAGTIALLSAGGQLMVAGVQYYQIDPPQAPDRPAVGDKRELS